MNLCIVRRLYRCKETILSIPIDELVDKENNVYEMTCVAISLANQIAKDGGREIEAGNNKVVSLVLERVLTEEVEFASGEKE